MDSGHTSPRVKKNKNTNKRRKLLPGKIRPTKTSITTHMRGKVDILGPGHYGDHLSEQTDNLLSKVGNFNIVAVDPGHAFLIDAARVHRVTPLPLLSALDADAQHLTGKARRRRLLANI